jgi:hypothetical protein
MPLVSNRGLLWWELYEEGNEQRGGVSTASHEPTSGVWLRPANREGLACLLSLPQ